MATKTGGGAQHLSVQESKNIQLGQLGSMSTDASSAAITPPTGTVFIAIQVLYNGVKFDTTTGLIAEDPDKYINTAQASSASGGTGGEAIDNTIEFPAGITLYGRWTSIDIYSGTHGVIAYIGV
jgi:hypothetical protein